MGPPPGTSVVVVIKFALKVVILAAVFLALTKWDVQFAGTDVLPGLQVDPNPNGPLGEFGRALAGAGRVRVPHGIHVEHRMAFSSDRGRDR